MKQNRTNRWYKVILALAVSLIGCSTGERGRGGGKLASADPRCASLCSSVSEGNSSACNDESTKSCLEVCAQYIEGASNFCANCLLEDSYLDYCKPEFQEVSRCNDSCLDDSQP